MLLIHSLEMSVPAVDSQLQNEHMQACEFKHWTGPGGIAQQCMDYNNTGKQLVITTECVNKMSADVSCSQHTHTALCNEILMLRAAVKARDDELDRLKTQQQRLETERVRVEKRKYLYELRQQNWQLRLNTDIITAITDKSAINLAGTVNAGDAGSAFINGMNSAFNDDARNKARELHAKDPAFFGTLVASSSSTGTVKKQKTQMKASDVFDLAVREYLVFLKEDGLEPDISQLKRQKIEVVSESDATTDESWGKSIAAIARWIEEDTTVSTRGNVVTMKTWMRKRVVEGVYDKC